MKLVSSQIHSIWRQVASFVTAITIFTTVVQPFSASAATEPECSQLLVLQSWQAALSQVSARANHVYQEDNSFDRRLLDAMDSRDKRTIKKLVGSVPFEVAVPDAAHSHWNLEVPSSTIEILIKELQDEGGELRLSFIPNASLGFRVDGNKPIISLPRVVTESVVEHELQHFRDWRNLKRQFIKEGMTAEKASAKATLKSSSPFGIFLTENSAKAAELRANIKALQNAIETENGQITIGGITGPITLLHKIEDLFHHIAWPYFEAIRRIADLREQARRVTFRATTLPANRVRYLKRLDELSERLLRDLTQELIQLKSKLATDSIPKKGLFELTNVSEFSKPLLEYFKLGIQRQEALLVGPTTLTNDEQTQIESLLSKNRSIRTEPQWRTTGFAKPERDRFSFSRDDLGAHKQLDVAGLGYDKSKDLLCSQRIDDELAHPVIDGGEIRLRQQAIGELLAKDGDLLQDFQGVFQPNDWRRGLLREGMAKLENLFQRDLPHELELPRFNILGGKEITQRVQYVVNQSSEFIREMQKIRTALAGATSPRLIGLKWVLDSLSSPDHPHQIADLIQTLTEGKSLKARVEAFNTLKNTKSHELDLLEAAYSEIVFYYDIANHAKQNSWHVFPQILDRDPKVGPVVTLINFHSPRASITNRQTSVPNSVDLSLTSGRNIIVTGPNAQGKSTFQRAIALLLLQAQMGGPIPADFAQFTPLTIRTYIHPSDKPSDDMSLFMSEAAALRSQIYKPSILDPFTLDLMDEVLPGTIPEIRTDVETEFLKELANTGVLSVTATHNWGTTTLANELPSQFRNFHVDRYTVKPGPTSDLEAMLDGAVEALRKVGWPEETIAKIRARGLARIRASQ